MQVWLYTRFMSTYNSAGCFTHTVPSLRAHYRSMLALPRCKPSPSLTCKFTYSRASQLPRVFQPTDSILGIARECAGEPVDARKPYQFVNSTSCAPPLSIEYCHEAAGPLGARGYGSCSISLPHLLDPPISRASTGHDITNIHHLYKYLCTNDTS